jgi:GTPase SAR1 family protein
MYYRDSQGVVICFDITNQDSFDTCDFWLKDIETHAPPNAIKILCGLKADLSGMREVDSYKAESFAKQNNMAYIEVSNKTGSNVDEMFQSLAQKIADF